MSKSKVFNVLWIASMIISLCNLFGWYQFNVGILVFVAFVLIFGVINSIYDLVLEKDYN